MRMELKPTKRVKTIRLKLIHFILLLVVCVCILLVTMIPQRMQINNAQDVLEQRQNELVEIKRQYEEARRSLDYMQTDEYKMQEGLKKYGWHYPVDELIPDESVAP